MIPRITQIEVNRGKLRVALFGLHHAPLVFNRISNRFFRNDVFAILHSDLNLLFARVSQCAKSHHLHRGIFEDRHVVVHNRCSRSLLGCQHPTFFAYITDVGHFVFAVSLKFFKIETAHAPESYQSYFNWHWSFYSFNVSAVTRISRMV